MGDKGSPSEFYNLTIYWDCKISLSRFTEGKQSLSLSQDFDFVSRFPRLKQRIMAESSIWPGANGIWNGVTISDEEPLGMCSQ